jgi:hypothetical protein
MSRQKYISKKEMDRRRQELIDWKNEKRISKMFGSRASRAVDRISLDKTRRLIEETELLGLSLKRR